MCMYYLLRYILKVMEYVKSVSKKRVKSNFLKSYITDGMSKCKQVRVHKQDKQAATSSQRTVSSQQLNIAGPDVLKREDTISLSKYCLGKLPAVKYHLTGLNILFNFRKVQNARHCELAYL